MFWWWLGLFFNFIALIAAAGLPTIISLEERKKVKEETEGENWSTAMLKDKKQAEKHGTTHKNKDLI